MASYNDTLSEVLQQYQRATSLPSISKVTRDKITATYGLPAGFGKGMTDAAISSDAAAAVLKKFVEDQAKAKTEPPPDGTTPPGGGSSTSWDPTKINWPSSWPDYARVSQQAAQEYAALIRTNYSPGGVFYGQGAVGNPYGMPYIPPEVDQQTQPAPTEPVSNVANSPDSGNLGTTGKTAPVIGPGGSPSATGEVLPDTASGGTGGGTTGLQPITVNLISPQAVTAAFNQYGMTGMVDYNSIPKAILNDWTAWYEYLRSLREQYGDLKPVAAKPAPIKVGGVQA